MEKLLKDYLIKLHNCEDDEIELTDYCTINVDCIIRYKLYGLNESLTINIWDVLANYNITSKW